MGILLAESDAAAAGGTMGLMGVLLMYALMFGAIYLLFLRPQSKEKKKIAAMLQALEVNDCVLTTSGFYGIVIDINEEDGTVIVEFGNNKNCRIPMEKSAISRVEKPEAN